jgi:hypothetical protein
VRTAAAAFFGAGGLRLQARFRVLAQILLGQFVLAIQVIFEVDGQLVCRKRGTFLQGNAIAKEQG